MMRRIALLLPLVVCLCASCQAPDGKAVISKGLWSQDAEEKAVSLVLACGGKVTRDENLPGRPVVGVDLLAAKYDIGDGVLKALVPLKDLRRLEVGGNPITDAGLKEAKKFRHLEEIGLMMAHVTDAGVIDFLKEHRDLRKLDLSQTRITGLSMMEIGQLKGLEELCLGDNPITDADLIPIKELKGLQVLSLIRTKVTDIGVRELKELKGLKTLYLCDNAITDAALQDLKELKCLQVLSLQGTAITKDGLNAMPKALPDTKVRYADQNGCTIPPR
jgi:hypothetical protein